MENRVVMAAIVTFNPQIERLKENIEAVRDQVELLLVFDNGSKNVEEIEKIIGASGILLIKNKKNLGIAGALKAILEYAAEHQIPWVLSLDQDSVVFSDLVLNYRKYMDMPGAGMLTCHIQDRNFKSQSVLQDTVQECKTCITSGSIISVDAYTHTSGYDEYMFIDGVDFDICFSLAEKNFKIYRIPYIGLLHEVGHGKNVKFMGRKWIVYHEPAWRQYYIGRNWIYLNKKHRRLFPRKTMVKQIIKDIVVIIGYENNRADKLKNYIKGLKDGLAITM